MTNTAASMENLQQQDKPVIGCFPLYPPLELFHSLGLVPTILWDLKSRIQDTLDSDARLQTFTCSVARTLTQFLLADDAPRFDALFMYNACDTLRNLPEIIAAGLSQKERPTPIFQLHIPAVSFDQPQAEKYLKNGISHLIQKIEAHFQVRFLGKNFSKSAVLYRDLRRRYRKLETRVAQGRLDFTAFNRLCCSGRHFPDESHLTELDSLIRSSDDKPNETMTGHRSPRILLSGIQPPPAALIQVMGNTGFCIAGNDIAGLSRSYLADTEPSEDPAVYYLNFYSQHPPCPTLLPSADLRVRHLLALAESRKADGVVWIGEKYCEYEYLEIPYLEKQLKKNGIPLLQLECSLDDKENIGAFKTRIEAFAELLEKK